MQVRSLALHTKPSQQASKNASKPIVISDQSKMQTCNIILITLKIQSSSTSKHIKQTVSSFLCGSFDDEKVTLCLEEVFSASEFRRNVYLSWRIWQSFCCFTSFCHAGMLSLVFFCTRCVSMATTLTVTPSSLGFGIKGAVSSCRAGCTHF